MAISRLRGAPGACLATSLLISAGTTDATLVGRLPATPGGTDYQAYYDTDLNITWLADANLAASNTFGTAGIKADGSMSWDTAGTWITNMNTTNYLGYNDWRLPTLGPINGYEFNDYAFTYDGSSDVGYNITAPGSAYPGSTANEMAHLFYNTLGNTGAYDTSGNETSCYLGTCLTNTGPFANLQPDSYWSGVEYGRDTAGSAWRFRFNFGEQSEQYKSNSYYAWPVRSGDVVPVPAATWLFGSGLARLLGVGWRRRPR